MKFSVALISKNEEKTLPRLLESLKGVDDIVLCDTGSTDKTVEIAKSFGVTVYEKKFDEVIDEKMAEEINSFAKKNGDKDIVSIGEKSFNFAKARNFIASKAKNDMVFMPDCDEIVEWDLNAVEDLLEYTDRLEYNFIFSFDEEGRPLIQFLHSKFYNRKKLEWVRNIHEVLAPKKYISSGEPKVSILIPTLNRPEGLKKVLDSIKEIDYQNIEVLYEEDEPRLGVAKRLNKLFEKSTGEYVIFGSDDIEFTKDSIKNAIKYIDKYSLIAFNTGDLLPDNGNICEHFMINREAVNVYLKGKIFDEDFKHVGVDNLLWQTFDRINMAIRADDAIIKHNHFSKGAKMDETYKTAWENAEEDRKLLQDKLNKLSSIRTVYTDKILLKHYQNHGTDRSQYLRGLAIDYLQNEYNDRNCHYFARELMYKGYYKTAIDFFRLHIAKPGWKTEQGQSYIYIGDCYRYLGDIEMALINYAIGFTYDMGRREPLMAIGQILLDRKQFLDAERIYKHALMIPRGNYYSNFEPNYTHLPHHFLSLALYYQGKKKESLDELKKAIELDPKNKLYEDNLKFYKDVR